MSNLLQTLSWPPDKAFPSLDVLRLAILNPSAAPSLLDEAERRDQLLSLLLAHLAGSKEAPANDVGQMLSLRAMSNLFSSPSASGRGLLLAQRDAIVSRAIAVLPKDNKNVQVALATLLLNYAVAACAAGRDQEEETQVQLITSLCMVVLEALADPEARFRALVALGTLLAAPDGGENARLARDLQPRAHLEAWKDQADAGSDKVPRWRRACTTAACWSRTTRSTTTRSQSECIRGD